MVHSVLDGTGCQYQLWCIVCWMELADITSYGASCVGWNWLSVAVMVHYVCCTELTDSTSYVASCVGWN